jgi:hypothetical protein
MQCNIPLPSRLISNFVWLVLLCASLMYATRAIADASLPAPEARATAGAGDADPASRGRLAFSHFTDHNGLPQNAIQAMAFDHRGYLWVGTQDGAAFYNGRGWTVVNMPNRTASNFVRSILVAGDGSIWFGRQEGGVSRLKDNQWRTFDEKSGLPDKRVNALLETRTDEGASLVWIGTDKGLVRLKGDEWTRFDGPPMTA